jgi:hypothetical protein
MRDMEPGDTKTFSTWKLLREAAPKVWAMSERVRDTLITEGVKAALDRALK